VAAEKTKSEKPVPAGPSLTPLDILSGGRKKKHADKKTEPKKTARKKYKRTTIDHHDNGSHTANLYGEGDKPEASFATGDYAGLMDGLKQHLGPEEPDGVGTTTPSRVVS